MRDPVRQTRSHLMQRFDERGLHPRHDLGQNFLIDLNIIEFIVAEGQLSANDVVLEIGSGTGGMTTFLAAEAGHVISVEIDPRMFALASEATAGCGNVTLLNQDALRNKNHLATEVLDAVRRELAVDPARRLKLVANLPYHVATPVVSNLVAEDLPWDRMIITIQWELAEKMTADPGSDEYGALSVWLQSQAYVKIIKRLPPEVFWPRPKVNSAIVRLSPDPRKRRRIANREFFHDFVRRIFQLRRKMIRGVLAGMFPDQLSKDQVDTLLASQGVSNDARAEKLDVARLMELSNAFLHAVRPAEGEPELKEPREQERADD